MRCGELKAVLEIESASFSRPWTEEHFQYEIDSPFGHPMVALADDGTLAGYLCLKLVLDEAEILDVAVKYSHRGKGIGRLLVQWALDFSREHGASLLFLEVRAGNAEAIALYRSLGFKESGRRKNYYDNGEDAILMEMPVCRPSEENHAV